MAETNTEVEREPSKEKIQSPEAAKVLAVGVPQTAMHSEAKQPALNCMIFLILSALLVIPKMFKFKTIVTGTAGCYLVYKNMFPGFEGSINSPSSDTTSAMNWLDLIVLIGMGALSCFRTVSIFTASLSFGYTFAYFATLLFDINQLSVFLLVMFFAAGVQLLLYEIMGLSAMTISHVFLAAYMMLSIVNVELFDVLSDLHNSENVTTVGKVMRKVLVVCLIVAAGGASLAFHSVLGTQKEEQIKNEGKKMLKEAEGETQSQAEEMLKDGIKKSDKGLNEEKKGEDKDNQGDDTGEEKEHLQTAKDEPEPEAKTEEQATEKSGGGNGSDGTPNDETSNGNEQEKSE